MSVWQLWFEVLGFRAIPLRKPELSRSGLLARITSRGFTTRDVGLGVGALGWPSSQLNLSLQPYTYRLSPYELLSLPALQASLRASEGLGAGAERSCYQKPKPKPHLRGTAPKRHICSLLNPPPAASRCKPPRRQRWRLGEERPTMDHGPWKPKLQSPSRPKILQKLTSSPQHVSGPSTRATPGNMQIHWSSSLHTRSAPDAEADYSIYLCCRGQSVEEQEEEEGAAVAIDEEEQRELEDQQTRIREI